MNDTCTLIVRLPADRDHLGTLELRDAKSRRLAGPFEVCGRADDTVARRNRNPTRNPLLPHGDMPLGEYRVKAGAAVDEVELEPRNGDAALADANGRFRFLIRGGGLRPMDDGLRLADSDLRELLRALGRLQGETCTCVVLKADAGRNKVPLTTPAPAPARRETPPPAPAPVPIMMSRTPRRSRLLMVFWLRALMGATGALVAMRSALGAIAASPPPDPSGDLRSVLSARGSSTSPVKPRFSPGRLFARMGGDYSQPEEETPAQQAPSEPAPEEAAPAQAPAEPEEEQEQQAPAEPEQQAPAEQERQAPAEQEQQAPAEQEQQAPAEQPQQEAPAEQEQQQEAPAEQQQAPEQEQQAPAEQEQQAPAEQQQAPAPAEPGGDTDAMDQLKNAEEKSQEAAKNPSLEGAHEDASQPFDKGGPIGTPTQEPNTVAPPTPGAVQVPLTPFPQGTQPGQTGSTDQPEQQAPQRSEPTQPQQVQPNQPEESQQEDQSGEAQPEENPSEETSPAETQPAEETHTQQAQPTERQSVQPPLAVPFGQRQGARPPARPAPVATPAWGGLDDIAAVNALAVRWRFTAEQRRLLDRALQAGRLRRAAAPTQDPAVIAAWQAIEARGQDPVLAREASNGHGLGFAGAGTQSFNDCPIFALSNAAALPYGVVAARAGELLRDATWHNADERANPQAVIEQGGLSMPEVIMLSQDVGRGAIVQSGGFAAALGQGHPIIVGVAMQDGDWSHGHMVALTTTFQHDGETWYVMMDSNQDSMERRFLSARELDAIRETNGLAFSPNPGQIPQVPRR